MPVAASAAFPKSFGACQEFPRSSLDLDSLVLPIFDCRLLIEGGENCHSAFSIDNRQSAIGNESLVFNCSRRLPSIGLLLDLLLCPAHCKIPTRRG
jgi:hypothetical protein